MRAVSVFFIALFIAGVVIQVLTYRKEKAVKPRRIIISQAAALLSMLVFSIITLRPPGPIWWVVLLTVGFAGGIGYGTFVNVRAGSRGVTMSYTLPWLITWGALMTITQLSSVVFRSVPVFIYGLAILNLGINLGMNARILLGYRTVAAVATAGLALALLVGVPAPAAEAQDGYDTALPEVMQGEVDGLSVDVLAEGGIYGDCLKTVFTNELGEPVTVLVPIGTRLLPETPQTQIMVTAGNELLEVTPGTSEFLVKGFCSLHSAGSPSSGTPFSFFEMADEDMLRVLRNIHEAGAFDSVGQYALWYVTDGGDLETMDPASRALVPDGIDEPTNTSDDYRAVGSEYDPDNLLDASGRQPLGPLQGAAAVGLSSLILAAGSLLQLTGTFDPNGILEALKGITSETPGAQPVAPPLPNELAGLPQSADGRVYMRVPWDEAGEAWVSADEARQTLKMQSQGYKWDSRWGWVTDAERVGYQAVNDANRAYNMEQDPELARISRQIQQARELREAQEAYAKRMAETAEARAIAEAKRDAGMREYTEAMGELSDAEWAYRGVVGVQIVADMAVGTIATVLTPTPLGPLAQGLRVGYNMAKGMGTAVGENMVGITEVDPLTGEVTTRHAFNATDLARGAKYGAVNTALDYTIEAGARKLLGQPQLWKELAPSPPVPANLLSPQGYLRQAVDGVEEIAARDGIDAAAAAVDPKKIEYLFREGGREQLGQLEALGKITKSEAAVINRVMDEQVGGSIQRGVSEATKAWDAKATGVTLERVVLGDSGSSAAGALGKTRSVLTDFDRTVVGVFNPDDVAKYAAERGISPAEAYKQLNQQLTDSATAQISKQMPGKLTVADADVKLYSGIGEAAGQKDAYASGFTATRQAVQGNGTVFRPDGLTYGTSGQAVVDEADLMKHAVGAEIPFTQPSFPASEFPQVAQQQVASLAKSSDPKTVAKALDRLLVMTGRNEVASTGLSANPQLADLARQIVRNPQVDKGTIALLAKNGYTPETFAAAVSEEGGRLAEGITRAVTR